MIFIVPAFKLLFSDFDRAVGHYRRYEKKFFKEFAKNNNIKCVKNHYFDSLGFFIVLIGKILKMESSDEARKEKWYKVLFNFTCCATAIPPVVDFSITMFGGF